ncbi:unnamed protein product [Blepharisma stoltei]|uniref:4a-hydroxytetrahydrobiopterin dehydratase n=1 Tax=Blepharisma stoltei TaxID=1481888 RepID=A0AAU9JVR7_9CILI|nr:unnamed protein product [Blepharisma stoltei]
MLRRFASLLTKDQLAGLNSALPSWSIVKDRPAIQKRFNFKDFNDAWEFMRLVAKVADQQDHHPEWFNVYGRVDVTLSTHDAGGITEKDVWLAQFMDKAESLIKHEHNE